MLTNLLHAPQKKKKGNLTDNTCFFHKTSFKFHEVKCHLED